ncbi:transposable element Tcb2 transposase [Trichonephila clavipes]|nr:transposable element Tcb2 transposase [Trichonephila clavipes]
MSSVGYASSSLYSNMFSPSILTWPPSLYVSLEVRPCEWKYTSKKSWPVVGCQRATTSARFRCLGNGPTVARASHDFPGVWVIWVTLIEEGRKITDVAREFDIAHSVVSRLWKSFKTTEMCSRRHGGGRVRSTTPAEDRYIVLSVKRNRRTTAQQVANQFLVGSGKHISRKTVASRLRGGGLYARRPVVCIPLIRQHRTAGFQWCREHHNWTE